MQLLRYIYDVDDIDIRIVGDTVHDLVAVHIAVRDCVPSLPNGDL